MRNSRTDKKSKNTQRTGASKDNRRAGTLKDTDNIISLKDRGTILSNMKNKNTVSEYGTNISRQRTSNAAQGRRETERRKQRETNVPNIKTGQNVRTQAEKNIRRDGLRRKPEGRRYIKEGQAEIKPKSGVKSGQRASGQTVRKKRAAVYNTASVETARKRKRKKIYDTTGKRPFKENKNIPVTMGYRMIGKMKFVFFVVSIILCFLIGVIWYINKVNGEEYTKNVLKQQSYVSSIMPYKRGTITDRNGIILAQSYKVYNVILDPKVLLDNKSNVEVTLNALSEIFELDINELRFILETKKDSSYVVLKKHQEYELMAAFEAKEEEQKTLSKTERIKGVWFEEEYIRNYPYNSLASHVIGYTSAGNVGTWGVEQYYNDELNGTDGRIYGYYDAELNLQRTVKEAVNGNNLVTTIDVNIQSVVERKIKEFRSSVECENIAVIVMDPDSGEIYAMASNEGFNLNAPYDLTGYYTEDEIEAMSDTETLNALNAMWRNFCISDTYEPGSTFKPFTVAAVMEENLVKTDEEFICNGYQMVSGYRIKCNNTHGRLTVAEAIMKSCNPVMMDISARLGKDAFYSYQRHFGFGSKTGIDLPGEAMGILIPLKNLNVTELATSSFGQGSNVTMIQLAAGMCALVNGGHYYQPHIVKEITDSNNVTIQTTDTAAVREVISASTSEFVREALYLTVEKGTAKAGQIEGYLIGGKTGTAQKGVRSADKTLQEYIVSFIGAAPMDDPEVVVFVVIDEIKDDTLKDKSSNATKITAGILEEILPYLGSYPDGEINYRVELPQIMVDTAGEPEDGNGSVEGGAINPENTIPEYNSDYDESVSDFIPPMDGVSQDISQDGETDIQE